MGLKQHVIKFSDKRRLLHHILATFIAMSRICENSKQKNKIKNIKYETLVMKFGLQLTKQNDPDSLLLCLTNIYLTNQMEN